MTWQVYIVRNEEGRRHIGLSEDVEWRLGQHNARVSKWTRKRPGNGANESASMA